MLKRFTRLIQNLENTSKTNRKLSFLTTYFQEATDSDKVWAIALFSGRRPKRQVITRILSEWAIEVSGIPKWLFEESYSVVGDLSETLALILPSAQDSTNLSLSHWIDYLMDLEGKEEDFKKTKILRAWNSLDKSEVFVFNKLITGGFRVGVSKNLVIKALAEVTGNEISEIAHRLTGDWDPAETKFEELILNDNGENYSKPYPFYLSYPIEGDITELGDPENWNIEWKWDGIRSQLIKRNGEIFLWSRGEELITEKFPEFQALIDDLHNGVVIDGELLPYKGNRPLSFSLLQTRIGRKNVTNKHLREAPAVIIAYDLLEFEGMDIRTKPLTERRAKLEELIKDLNVPELKFSENVTGETWSQFRRIREDARSLGAEGFMIKHRYSVYRSGRKRGDWWKWKVDPFSIDAVMIYAQKGHGRRADIFSDYTFAVWNEDQLVPFAKAYSGLTDKELIEVTRFVQDNTLERFGPVRTVPPVQVFELHFEGIQRSSRHKSGIAVRFPRIHRWRRDKKPEEANTLQDLKALLEIYGQ